MSQLKVLRFLILGELDEGKRYFSEEHELSFGLPQRVATPVKEDIGGVEVHQLVHVGEEYLFLGKLYLLVVDDSVLRGSI